MSKLIKEFKEFAMKGNVMDMAIGVIIGGAFGAIVTSIVQDILTPIIGLIFGQPDFSAIHIGGVKNAEGVIEGGIMIGNFINAVINFVIIALCLFAIVKAMNKLKKPAPAPKAARKCPFCKGEIADDATRCPHCTSELK